MANRPASTRFSAPFPIRFHLRRYFAVVSPVTEQTRSIHGRIEVTGIDVNRCNRVIGRRDLILPLIREIDRRARILILLHADNEFISVYGINFNLVNTYYFSLIRIIAARFGFSFEFNAVICTNAQNSVAQIARGISSWVYND